MSTSSIGESSFSPSQMALDLQPHLTSIEAIASEHGLSHDSGVSFGMSSRKRQALQQQQGLRGSTSNNSLKRVSTIGNEVTEEAFVTESPTTTSAFDAREDVWRDVARRLKPFGDTLRHERLRTALGQSKLSESCIFILEYSCQRDSHSAALHEAQTELLRTLANLCIDHDENRSVLLQHQGPQAVTLLLNFLLASDDADIPISEINLLRIATGALLNMQLDHAQTRLELRRDTKAMQTLLLLATDSRIYFVGEWYTGSTSEKANGKQKVSTGANIAAWTWRIIQDICTGEAKEADVDIANMGEGREEVKLIDGLVDVGAEKVAQYLTIPLQPLISDRIQTTKGPWTADDVCDLIESDMEMIQIVSELLEGCAIDSKAFRLSSLSGTLDFMMTFLDQAAMPKAWLSNRSATDDLPPIPSDEEMIKDTERRFGRAKSAISKAIIIIAGEDENMETLFRAKENGFVDVFKNWMTRDVKIRDDLVSTAMLAMGNLARRDSHCLALVHDHDIVPTLTALLKPSADFKVAHGIICLLKNLSLPADNKLIIGSQYKCMPLIQPFLLPDMDRVQPLQFAAVGLLKHLCAGCVPNAITFVTAGGIFEALLKLVQRTEDLPTRMEGTRVLVNVTKTLWSGNVDANRAMIRQKIVSSPVTMALAEMVRSSPKYPVLVNEGILAMTLIASEREKHGAHLVATALLSDPAMEELNAMTGELDASSPISDKAASPIEARQTNEKGTNTDGNNLHRKGSRLSPQKQRAPTRKTTMDSLASQSSQPLPAPRTSADMIANVLARRDARMPPQFASNACVFVQTLIDGSQATTSSLSSSSTTSHNQVDPAIRQVLQSWLQALHRLSEVGPQETIAIAKKSLKSMNEYLAMH